MFSIRYGDNFLLDFAWLPLVVCLRIPLKFSSELGANFRIVNFEIRISLETNFDLCISYALYRLCATETKIRERGVRSGAK